MSFFFEKIIEGLSTVLLISLAILVVELFRFMIRKKILTKLFLQQAVFLLVGVTAFGAVAYLNNLPPTEGPSAEMQKIGKAIEHLVCNHPDS